MTILDSLGVELKIGDFCFQSYQIFENGRYNTKSSVFEILDITDDNIQIKCDEGKCVPIPKKQMHFRNMVVLTQEQISLYLINL